MYTGIAVADVGGALIAGSWWPIATLPLALVAVRQLVIRPEERCLNDVFGDAFVRYQQQTRRWL